MSHVSHTQPDPGWPATSPDILTRDDFDAVRAAVAEVAPSWSAELNHTGPGESTIVILPEGANDLIGPAFILHRANGRVRLDQFRWDEYRALGGFHDLTAALAALRARLVPLVSSRPRLEGGLP